MIQRILLCFSRELVLLINEKSFVSLMILGCFLLLATDMLLVFGKFSFAYMCQSVVF